MSHRNLFGLNRDAERLSNVFKVSCSLLIVIWQSFNSSFAASFDCQKASRSIEKMICSNDELSSLDEKLSVVYARSIAASADKGAEVSAQRQWLRNYRDRCDNSACAIDAYKKRLAVVERYSGGYAEIPDSGLIKTLCEKLMLQSVREEIVSKRDGVDDINNDGHKENAQSCWGGTMNTPCTDYSDSKGNKVSINQANYERKDWVLGERTFRYAGRTFSLLFRDYEMQKPISLTYVTPSNEEYALCKFNTVVSSALADGERAAPVCKALLSSSSQIQQVTFIDAPDFGFDANKQRDLNVNGSGAVDIDNDGSLEQIIEVQYDNGGGRGCSFNYFDILNESGKNLLLGTKRSILLTMQHVPEADFYIRGCGNIHNRLFRYLSETYFERNVSQEEGERTVSILKRGNVTRVCNFVRVINVESFKQVGAASMYFNE